MSCFRLMACKIVFSRDWIPNIPAMFTRKGIRGWMTPLLI